MAGEVYVGKLTNGHMIIGEINKDFDDAGGERILGLQKAYMIMLVPDQQNQQRIAVNMKSMFWPLSDEGAIVEKEHMYSITEITTPDLISEYVRTKTNGKLDIVTGEDASQVMSQLNQQMKEAKTQGIIKE